MINPIAYRLTEDEELVRLFPLIQSITLIEYDGECIQGSCGLHEFIHDIGSDTNHIRRIVVCGELTESLEENVAVLRDKYPEADIIMTNHDCNHTDFAQFNIRATMVFHMIDCKYNGVLDLIDNARNASPNIFSLYHVVVGEIVIDNDIFNNRGVSIVCKSDLRLHTTWKVVSEQPLEQSVFCQERQQYLKVMQKSLSPSEYLYQCIAMVSQGCEDCALASSYGCNHQCPLAQLALADCYRMGIFVDDNRDIAYQWSRLAAIQGYRPAQVQVIEDLLNGREGNQAISKGLYLLKNLALKGDLDCLRRYISFREEQMDGVLDRELLNAMVCLAQQGDEKMLTRLLDAFERGEMGFPVDSVQLKEWEEVAISKGGPIFLRKLIDRHTKAEQWDKAYARVKQLWITNYDNETKNEMLLLADNYVDAIVDDNQRACLGLNYYYGYNGFEIDKLLARKLIEKASNAGVPMAKGLLGRMYIDELGFDESMEMGLSLIREAIRGNDPLSIEAYILDEIPGLNDGSISDRHIRSLLNRAIDEGHVYALYVKACCTYKRGFFRMASNKVFDAVRELAKAQYPPALNLLSCLFEKGFGTELDKDNQISYLKKAADLGDVDALGRYGLYLYEVLHNPTESFSYLDAAIQRDTKKGRVHYRHACCVRDGHGCMMDIYKYEYSMDAAAYYGVLEAQVELCLHFFKGTYDGKIDYKECARYGEMAIKQGEKSVRFETAYSQNETGNTKRAKELYYELCCEGSASAMNNYACLLSDKREQFEWYQKSAQKGDSYGLRNIGIIYRDGNEFIAKDLEKGIRLIKEAANKGCETAMEDLAIMYEHGNGVPLDGNEALKWYKAAINKDRGYRLMDVARLYRDGTIIQRDIDKAIEYYRLAIDKGFPKARFCLGHLFENGYGRQPEMEKAIYWYRSAVKAGVEEAKDRLMELGIDSLTGQEGKDV